MKFAIDAGHGPNTPGKRAPDDSMREYTFNSAVADKVCAILNRDYGVEVFKTYTPVQDVPLGTRTGNAIRWGADAFISIHANAAGSAWSSAHGIETFYYSGAHPPQSEVLAANIQTALIRNTGLANRSVKRDDFQVIRDTSRVGIPAVLIECGFMTNHDELKKLKSDAFRDQCAVSIVEGIVTTFSLKKKGTGYKMKESDIDAVIKHMQAQYAAAKTTAEKREIGRLTDEFRKVVGRPTQN